MTDKPDHPDPWLPRWKSANPFFDNSMLNREKVKFRDGSDLIVYEENQVIAEYIIELEQEADNNPHPDAARQLFRKVFYSKLIACSAGDVPTDEQARMMPAVELNKWIEAVRRINPNWFVNLDNALSQMSDDEKKRKPRKRRKSGNG